MKPGKLLCCLLIVFVLLPACTSAPATEALPMNTASATALPTFVYIIPPTIPTATPFSSIPTVSFFTSAPHIGPIPTSTPTKVLPTKTPAPTKTRELLPFQVLEGLRVAYSIDGNLYVQDSGKQAIQLTHTRQDSNPTFTDDGQKIIFYRASESQKKQLYSINSDGTGERVLVISDLLPAFGWGYDEITELTSPVIVPGTHQILFSTQQLNFLKRSNMRSTPNNDLLLADIDTGAIKQLSAIGQGGFFFVSPNGELVAVQAIDHIDVIDLQGQIVRRNLVTHSPVDDYYGYKWWATLSWTRDSSELIVLPSDIPPGTGFPMFRTIWRYPVDGHSGIEIKMNPSPIGDALSISPDGNWIVYSYDLGNLDPQTTSGVYLGNLHDGTSQLIYSPQVNERTGIRDLPPFYHSWSLDSTRFTFEDYNMQLYVGSFQGEITPLYRGGYFSWIDNQRYFYGGDSLGEIGKEKKVRVMEYPAGFVLFESGLTSVFLGNDATP